MTKGEAVDALYAVFNAPHNADINIAYLNKILDDLVAAEREACIKVCEQLEQEWEDAELWASFKAVGFVIDAIRSRT